MTPTLASPLRTWPEQLSVGFAGALALIGVATLGGWWLQVEELLQPLGPHAALSLHAALGFTLLAIALFGVEQPSRRLVFAASGGLVLGAGTIIAAISGLNLPLDRALVPARLFALGGTSGHAALVLDAGLVISSTLLLWRLSERGKDARRFFEAGAGTLIASAGLFTLLGYFADLRPVYTWGTEQPVAPLGGVALAVLGLALLHRAWRESTNADGDAPPWAPLPIVVGCATLTVALGIGLRAREQAYTTQTTQAQLDQFAAQTKDALEKQSAEFERLARAWGDGPDNDTAAWTAGATRQLAQESAALGATAIAVLDTAARPRWSHPPAAQARLAGFDHNATEERRTALALAGRGGARSAIAMGAPAAVGDTTERGFAIYAPVIRNGQPAGFVTAEFSYRGFFQHIATARVKLHDEYHIAVALAGESIFQRAAADPARDIAFTLDRTYLITDRRLRISLTPSAATLAQNRRYLPELALAAGFGITGLLGLSVHLARRARAGQRAAEQSNRMLFAENEERSRIEARLKVSDDRLRLALDSTQIGIFEWSIDTGRVYYSPGLWAMLGYDYAAMPPDVATWQTLIHPDDLAVYLRRIDSQLDGTASFIEPEYRVRAKTGAWRWVYSRSKTVATNAIGRPTQIIGTVQDITARREAEHALRESQSEARKLSLVASKTDSPVLIGTADGLIEWANEAFCRVMEYPLAEVIGRNPAHFMIGPETDPRAIARIRAAMARGQGISTDVVNYSKSGRKFHLHIEIQPVHGVDGKVTNFIAVETDITGRVEVEQQLRRAKAEADETSRAKSDFLASMSHEIRTPMNGVIGMTSLLMETPLNPEQRDYVNTIRTSGEALLTIINDILDFSKIESGKMELEQAPFDLSHCLEDALDLFALQASAKKVELGYFIAPDVPPWIRGDVTRLRQVMVNLVNNAVKFTPSGSIAIEVRRAASEPAPVSFPSSRAPMPVKLKLEFTVRDTGIGIPADRVDRLFKAFSQVDSSTTRKYGGTGLGLAICQRLCQLMGGQIRVESGVGQGSAFVFTIDSHAVDEGEVDATRLAPPMRGGSVLCVGASKITAARLHAVFDRWGVACIVVPDAAVALATAEKLPRIPSLVVIDGGEVRAPITLDLLTTLHCPRLLLFPFGQPAPSAPADGQPFACATIPLRTSALVQAVHKLFAPKVGDAVAAEQGAERPIAEEFPLEILIAEDNAVNQKVAVRFLERLGYRADAVANGLEAVTTLEHRCFDLVLMDLQMPEMDGFEATRQIRARVPADRQPKIVALTANAMQGDREACLAAGMDGYISKPVKMHEIAETIRRLFGKPVPPDPAEQTIG